MQSDRDPTSDLLNAATGEDGPPCAVADRISPLIVDLVDRLVVAAMGTGAEVAVSDGPVDGHDFVAVPRF